MIAPYLASSLVNLSKGKQKSIFLMKDHNSSRMNDFVIHGDIPVTLYSKMLAFRDYKRSFKLGGYLLRTMINFKFKVGPSKPQDRKRLYEFAK